MGPRPGESQTQIHRVGREAALDSTLAFHQRQRARSGTGRTGPTGPPTLALPTPPLAGPHRGRVHRTASVGQAIPTIQGRVCLALRGSEVLPSALQQR